MELQGRDLMCDTKTQRRSLAGVTSCFHDFIQFPVSENYMVHSLEKSGPRAQPAYSKMVSDLYRGVKQQGRGFDHSPPSSAEVNVRVELYIFSLCGLSLRILGRNLPCSYNQEKSNLES
jgi:hypothetical protein